MPHVGAPLKRLDDPRLLTGRGRYVDDITLPRMVHVAFVRSPHAHATITRVDVDTAATSPDGGGEPDAAFAAAPRAWRRRFTTGRHTGVPMEPRGLVADFEPATRALTVWISTQVPHMMQAVLAELFGLPEHRVRVIAPDVGGSFGIKIHVYQDDPAAVALALRLGRAVKFGATRRQPF